MTTKAYLNHQVSWNEISSGNISALLMQKRLIQSVGLNDIHFEIPEDLKDSPTEHYLFTNYVLAAVGEWPDLLPYCSDSLTTAAYALMYKSGRWGDPRWLEASDRLNEHRGPASFLSEDEDLSLEFDI